MCNRHGVLLLVCCPAHSILSLLDCTECVLYLDCFVMRLVLYVIMGYCSVVCLFYLCRVVLYVHVCRFLFMWYALLALAVLCLALYLFVYTIICCLCCSVCVAGPTVCCFL